MIYPFVNSTFSWFKIQKVQKLGSGNSCSYPLFPPSVTSPLVTNVTSYIHCTYNTSKYVCVYIHIHFSVFLKKKTDKCGSDNKESACDAGDLGLIPGLGSSPGEGNGNIPTPVFLLSVGNPMDRGAWRATVHGVTKSRKQLSE